MSRKYTTDARAADYDLNSRNEGVTAAFLAKAKPTGRAIAVATALCMTLSACETMQNSIKKINPFTGKEEVSNTAVGVGVGAAGGAAVGAVAGGRKGALIGAGVGALTGGAVGYYMDKQEDKLRDQLRGTGVSVTRAGDSIILNMPGNVTFATNSSDVSANFYPVLNSVGHVLNEYEQTYVDVIGHTDSRGSADYNQRLSERRASSVANYLETRKVISQRIEARGMGETSPIAPNDTKNSRALNRRVEIKLTPVT